MPGPVEQLLLVLLAGTTAALAVHSGFEGSQVLIGALLGFLAAVSWAKPAGNELRTSFNLPYGQVAEAIPRNHGLHNHPVGLNTPYNAGALPPGTAKVDEEVGAGL